MKVFYAPKVILVGRPSIVWDGVRELMEEYGIEQSEPRIFEGADGWVRHSDDDSDGDGLPELMGRLCYGSFGKAQGRVGAEAYLGHILDAGHGSVLEHANWSFVACRAGRGYTHQMVRHRAGFAYSQESTHFIKYGDGMNGSVEARACLTGLDPDSAMAGQAADACKLAVEAYGELWETIRQTFPEDAKVKKQVSGTARQLLPNAIESRLGFTGNARALRHFVEMRGNPSNTIEVRLVAAQVAEIMRVEAPAIFQDVAVNTDDDQLPTVTVGHHKV